MKKKYGSSSGTPRRARHISAPSEYQYAHRVFLLGIYPRDMWGAILLHIPVGLAAVAIAGVGCFITALLWVGIALSVSFTASFLIYEIVEFIKINLADGWGVAKDSAYPEVCGYCWGIFLGYIILSILAGVL